MKKLSIIFGILAVLLSDIMCARVAYDYCNLLWGGKYALYSAPPNAAFLTAIPYVIGIVICVILALIFRKKSLSNKF